MPAAYLTKCGSCGRTTSRAYARTHGGRCKSCETGTAPAPRRRGTSRDAIAREGGYEDTMGVSYEVLESRYDSYGDY